MADDGSVFASTKARITLMLRRKVGSEREDRDFDTMYRRKVLQIVVFSMLGLASVLIIGLTSWSIQSGTSQNLDAYYDDPDISAKLLDSLYVAQAFTTASTVVTIILIIQKYQLELIRKRAEWAGSNILEVEGFRGVAVRDPLQRDYFLKAFSFWRSYLVVNCGLEILVHALHPIVWMASYNNVPASPADFSYTTINLAYKLFQLAMFLRLYVFFELIMVFDRGYRNRFEVVSNDPDLLSVGFQVDMRLTVMMALHAYPTTVFAVASLLSLIVFGYSVFMLERVEGPIDPNAGLVYIKPENAFWFAFVTTRTIGFGEFSPRTVLGRVAASLCAMFGIVASAVFSGILVAQSPLTKELKLAVEFLETSTADNQLREAAANLIQTAWRVSVLRRARSRLEGKGRKRESETVTASVASDNVAKAGAKEVAGAHDDEDDDEDVFLDPAERLRKKTRQGLLRFGIDLSQMGHKADRMYGAIKKFRNARKEVANAFTQANDVVVNQKMDSLLSLTNALKRETLAHQKDFDLLEKQIIDGFSETLRAVVHYRKLGHHPV